MRVVAPLGTIEVITGSMFSGKTEELISLYASSTQRIALKPASDTRHRPDVIVSHDGRSIPAIAVSAAGELMDSIARFEVVFVDEIQFFDSDMVGALILKAREGARVVAAGLDFDFRRNAFRSTSQLAEHANALVPKTAICSRCGGVATATQRFVGGRPASLEDSVFVVGDLGLYEPRCESCWKLERSDSG